MKRFCGVLFALLLFACLTSCGVGTSSKPAKGEPAEEETYTKQDIQDEYNRGYDRGYEAGLESAREEYSWYSGNEDYDTGYSTGRETGYENGYDSGYECGYDDGYLAALEDYGISDSDSQSVQTIVSTAALSTSITRDATVYVTVTGTKFHREDCYHLSVSKIPMSRADAIAAGYDPCMHCDP